MFLIYQMQLFIRELTDKYIKSMEAEDDEDAMQKMREEITSLHESLLAMRYVCEWTGEKLFHVL